MRPGRSRRLDAATRLPVQERKNFLSRALNTQRNNMVGLWMLDDASGRTAVNLAPGRIVTDLELTENGNLELHNETFTTWITSAGDGAVDVETTLVHGGSHAAKLTAGASANTFIRPANTPESSTLHVLPGDQVNFTFWTRGDGTNGGRYNVYDSSNGAWIVITTATGVAGTDYEQVTVNFTAPAGCYRASLALLCSTANGGICYFDDASVKINSYENHGVYQPSGITYRQPGIIPGHGAVVLSGTNTAIQHGHKGWNQVANPNLGSVIAWGKVDAGGRWTDAATYRYLWHPKSRQDATVYMVVGKTSGNHQLTWRRRVAGSIFEKLYTFPVTGTLDWFCMGMTWDVLSVPKNISCYLYTHEDRVFQTTYSAAPGSGVETWDLDSYSLDDTNCVLMAGNLSAQNWIGSGGPVIEWAGVALSAAEMKKVMRP